MGLKEEPPEAPFKLIDMEFVNVDEIPVFDINDYQDEE